jgi:hypothetical protein
VYLFETGSLLDGAAPCLSGAGAQLALSSPIKAKVLAMTNRVSDTEPKKAKYLAAAGNVISPQIFLYVEAFCPLRVSTGQ